MVFPEPPVKPITKLIKIPLEMFASMYSQKQGKAIMLLIEHTIQKNEDYLLDNEDEKELKEKKLLHL